jgi:hypothetical protein
MDSENLLSRITLNPNISFGKPTIRNMRYAVEVSLDLLSAGMPVPERWKTTRIWRRTTSGLAWPLQLSY